MATPLGNRIAQIAAAVAAADEVADAAVTTAGGCVTPIGVAEFEATAVVVVRVVVARGDVAGVDVVWAEVAVPGAAWVDTVTTGTATDVVVPVVGARDAVDGRVAAGNPRADAVVVAGE